MNEFNFNSYDNSKQTIIIDGVNVEECGHFNYGEGYNQETEESVEGACECITAHDSYGEFMYYGICKGRNCYYKQLKRKEEECERLDNEAQNLFTEKTNLEIELTQLKAENERYKQALEEIREIQKDCDGCNGDCVYCYSGSGWIFKLADEVLKGNFEVLDERN